MFDGTFGEYTGSDYTIELKEDAKPYHAKPFTLPHIHRLIFKKEVERLLKIGVLRKLIIPNGQLPLLKNLRKMVQ